MRLKKYWITTITVLAIIVLITANVAFGYQRLANDLSLDGHNLIMVGSITDTNGTDWSFTDNYLSLENGGVVRNTVVVDGTIDDNANACLAVKGNSGGVAGTPRLRFVDLNVTNEIISSGNSLISFLNETVIRNVGAPVVSNDVVIKSYVEDNFVSKSGGIITGQISVNSGGEQISINEPGGWGSRIGFYADSGWYGSIGRDTDVGTEFGAINQAASDYINFKVATPVDADDAATKAYVDANSGGASLVAVSNQFLLKSGGVAGDLTITNLTAVESINDYNYSNFKAGYLAGDGSRTSNSVFLGSHAGNYANGDYNSYLGYYAGNSANGNNNSYLGYYAGYSADGDYNSYLGRSAGISADGDYNSYLGYYAGYSADGDYNSYLGRSAGYSADGDYNSYLGSSAGQSANGNNNSYLGYYAGQSANGNNNSYLGYGAGQYSISTNNLYLGSSAGRYQTNENKAYFGNFITIDCNTAKVVNVTAGTDLMDAVNVAQLNALITDDIQLKMSNVIYVAINGGHTDDLKVAVETLCPDGGVVLVAPGIYHVSSSIAVSGKRITVKGLGSHEEVKLISTANTMALFEINNSTFFGLENVTVISTNTSNSGGGVKFTQNINNGLIRNCKFSACRSSSNGGGIHGVSLNAGNKIVVEGCVFESCTSGGFGGGIYALSFFEIDNCTFDSCVGVNGGGVYVYSSDINNCIFENCTSSGGSGTGGGGGVLANNSKVNNSIFDSCAGVNGGGVYAYSSDINNCSFESCTSVDAGGAINSYSSVANGNQIFYCVGKTSTDTFVDNNVANTFWFRCLVNLVEKTD